MNDSIARIAALDPKKRELLLQRLRERAAASGDTAIKRLSRDGRTFVLTYAQQRLWFLQQLEPNSAHYNIPGSLALSGAVVIGALERGLREIIRRHEALRTSFREENGEPRQIIAGNVNFSLPVIDLGELVAEASHDEAQRLVDENAQQLISLSKAPLFRASVLRIGEQQHILIMSINHIVSDGWSNGILRNELGVLYEAFRRGRGSPLKELEVQYADYAEWQKLWLEGEELRKNLNYWKEELSGMPEVIALPTDGRREGEQSHKGSAVVLTIGPEKAEALRTVSRKEASTLFMTLLAGLQSLLYRYSGQEDICVGTPVANRNKTEVEALIGCFVNTLLFRGRMGGEPTFEEMVRRARGAAIGAYDHQEMPFEKIVEELRPARTLSHNPLFQVMFALQNMPSQELEMEGVNLREVAARLTPTQFDLNVTMVEESEGRILCIFQYDRTLFDEQRMERMMGHFERLIEDATEHPTKRISELELLGEGERHEILVDWNDTGEWREWRSLSEVVNGWVEETGDRIAAGCREEEISYKELWRRSGIVAARLRNEGVVQESIVAVVLDRGIEFLAVILGIMRAGAAYLPMDPRHPIKRNVQVMWQSRAGCVIGEEMYTREMKDGEKQEVTEIGVDELLWQGQEEWDDKNESKKKGGNLSYAIYTSGSTGTPKGAMVEEKGMMNHLWAKVTDLELTRDDVVAQTAPQVFDISVWQNFAGLVVGGRVEILKDEEAHDPRRLIEEVEEKRITVLETVPSMMREILEELRRKGEGVRVGVLRWMIATGEALDVELAREWNRVQPHVGLMNAYGPTECSDDVTHQNVEGSQHRISMAIGRPILNTQIYVLNESGGVVPIGVNGNIFVGGQGVGRGYLNEPDKTARVFVPNRH